MPSRLGSETKDKRDKNDQCQKQENMPFSFRREKQNLSKRLIRPLCITCKRWVWGGGGCLGSLKLRTYLMVGP